MKKSIFNNIRTLFVFAVLVVLSIIFIKCQESNIQDKKTFEVQSVNFGELGWGKNSLTIKARNLVMEARKLYITINTCYLNGDRLSPLQTTISFDFDPKEEKEISRYFYIRPDHGTLEISLEIKSESKTKLRETIHFKKYIAEFEAPNSKINQLEFPYPEKIGFERAVFPAFNFSTSEHFIFYYLPYSEVEKNMNNILSDWEKNFNELQTKFNTNITEKIKVFILPDSISSMMTLLHPGGRLISKNTIILTNGMNYDSKKELSALFNISSLIAYRNSDFWAITGGYGSDGMNYRPERLKVVLGLYEGLTINEIIDRMDMSENQVLEAIHELENNSIIKKENGKYKPDFLILTKKELQSLLPKIDIDAKVLAGLIEKKWSKVKRTYKQLSFADIFPIERTGFNLIGSIFLESGMIDMFFKDQTLMSPYPKRPIKDDSTTFNKSRFYCFLMEGREFPKQLYGLNGVGGIDKPKFITYGKYAINLPRSNFDRNLRILLRICGNKDKFVNDFLPEYQNKIRNNKDTISVTLMDSLIKDFPYRIPKYTNSDMIKVNQFVSDLGSDVLEYFKKNKNDLESIFRSFKGNEFTSFSEFFYFYYHFVFASATNYAADRGLFKIPEYTFDYWMQDDPIRNLVF
ncbi:hypothetical protein ACFLRR_02920 [Bacteroidota bacterium]